VDRGLVNDVIEGRDRARKRNMSNPQLLGEFLIIYDGVCPGVDEGDQGLETPWQEKSGVKQGSLLGGGTC